MALSYFESFINKCFFLIIYVCFELFILCFETFMFKHVKPNNEDEISFRNNVSTIIEFEV